VVVELEMLLELLVLMEQLTLGVVEAAVLEVVEQVQAEQADQE
jgi:hypothetical protein